MANTSAELPNLSTVVTDTASAGSSASGASSATATNTDSAGSTATDTASQTGSSASDSATTASSASVITGAPSLTSGISISQLTGLPTLSGYYSYPPPSVPPTANAPYMQSVNLPQNFVFIIVGAVIAFFALCILLWRFLAAWSINKNIKRDGTAVYTPLHDMKKTPLKPTESSHDMADLSALPKSFGNSVPSLFFSPTAEVARQSMARPLSQHMPSGHYRDASK